MIISTWLSFLEGKFIPRLVDQVGESVAYKWWDDDDGEESLYKYLGWWSLSLTHSPTLSLSLSANNGMHRTFSQRRESRRGRKDLNDFGTIR